jgi:hypothetical protein
MAARTLETDKDIEEAIRIAASRDTEALKRVRAESDAFRKEMAKKYGNRDIAVQLIHDARNGE